MCLIYMYHTYGAVLQSELPGFYDPCMGEEKQLLIVYEFRRQLHQAQYTEPSKILIPHRGNLLFLSIIYILI